MATPESIGTAQCHNCGSQVYICKNKGGFAYYRCGRCQFEGRHHSLAASQSYLNAHVAPFDENPPGKSPENPAPTPPAKPAAKKGSLAELMGA